MKYPYKLIEKSENNIIVEMLLTKDMDFFDGHFNELPIMPAVAQLYIVETCAKEIMGIKGKFASMRQVKFVGPIFPDSCITLDISYSNGKIIYQILSNRALKSKGIMNYNDG